MSPVPVREKDSRRTGHQAEFRRHGGCRNCRSQRRQRREDSRDPFGSQIKNYEARFARLEEALARETSEIKDTMRRRLDSLEAFFKSETESLAARLKSERDEREETLNNISRELKTSAAQLSKKILDLDNRLTQDRSAARQELMAESRKLLDEIRQRNESLSSLLETRVPELRHAKTDRSALAALFVELAVRLKDESDEVKERPKAVRSAGA